MFNGLLEAIVLKNILSKYINVSHMKKKNTSNLHVYLL